MKPTSHNIIIDGKTIPIEIRRHKTARHMIIRYHPAHHVIRLTLPRYTGIRQGLRFVADKQVWIANQIQQRSQPIMLKDGGRLPLLGNYYTLHHHQGRGTMKLSHDPLQDIRVLEHGGLYEHLPYAGDARIIHVHGDAEFFARRLRDWLKKLAACLLDVLVQEKSRLLGVRASRVSVRDTRSHWGSCNEHGRMTFSWRLVMAPYEVLEYVVCHEVAHLKEMNHSRKFWQYVESLCPHWQQSRNWLKHYGDSLHNVH
ncbi:MAG: M48 family metallopeptidase [Alphaproteobacteria bacterium]